MIILYLISKLTLYFILIFLDIHPGRQLAASATNSPYSIAGLNGWHPMQNNNNAGATEGYTRAIQNLDDLRPPPLPFSTHQRSAAVRQNEP